MVTSLRHWAHALMEYRDGTITQGQWAMLIQGIPLFVNLPGFQPIWESVNQSFPADFRDYIASLMQADESLA